MANITYLSNQAGFPVDDNPGGDTPVGTISWHDSFYYDYYVGYTSAPKDEYSFYQHGFKQLLNSNRLAFNRNFQFIASASSAQRAYDLFDLDGAFILSKTAAIVAPWTVDEPSATAWAHNGHDKLIYSSSRSPDGTNRAKILAVDVDTGLYFTSITPTQISAITGATTGEIENTTCYTVVSPDGTHILTDMVNKVGGYVSKRFYRVDQNGLGEFTGLSVLTGVASAPVVLTGSTHLLGCTNSRVLMTTQGSTSGGSGDTLTIRDIDDLSLISTVTLSGGSQFFGTAYEKATITKGNHIYFSCHSGTTTTAAYAVGPKLFKLNMNTGSIVGSWNIGSAPVQSGFTSTLEPGSVTQDTQLSGIGFTPGGTLYLSYYNDYQNMGLAAWGSPTYQHRNRIYRATLS